MNRFLLGIAALVVLQGAAQGQGCYGGSPGGYGYSNGYSNGYSRGYSFGGYGLPPASYGYDAAPPAVYESRTPYYAQPARYYDFPPRREFLAPQRFSFEQRGFLGRPRTRVSFQSGGFCPGGY